MSVTIVPATREILERYYGRPMPKSARAIAAIDGDRILGVAGVVLDEARLIAFVHFSEELKRNRRVIVRGGRILQQMMRRGVPVHAEADSELESADRFLRHYGFRRVEGQVYAWTH